MTRSEQIGTWYHLPWLFFIDSDRFREGREGHILGDTEKAIGVIREVNTKQQFPQIGLVDN